MSDWLKELIIKESRDTTEKCNAIRTLARFADGNTDTPDEEVRRAAKNVLGQLQVLLGDKLNSMA